MKVKLSGYLLICEYDITIFNQKVNEKISEGWVPYKGSYFQRYNQHHCQVVIKY